MNNTNISSPRPVCAFDGNADIYGVGVRIGLYLQWFATLLVTLYMRSLLPFVRTVNLVFQAALMIGVASEHQRDNIRAIEPIIALWLCFGALSSLTGDGFSPFGTSSGTFRVLLYAGISGYTVWFWFVGIDGLLQQDCEYIALPTSITIDGWFRRFNQVLSVFGVSICFLLFAIAILVCLPYNFSTIITSKLPFATTHKSDKNARPQVEIPLLILSLTIIFVSISMVETLIRINDIRGANDINSIGQLLALMAGCMGIVSVGKDLLPGGESNLGKGRCWLLFGRHLS
jgi:hypothetical protein